MTVKTEPSDQKKRFTSGEHPDLEDIADPHTLEDDTGRDWGKTIKSHWKFLAIVGPIAAASVLILAGYFWYLVPEIVTNRYVQALTFLATLVGVTAYVADRSRLSWFKAQDELVLRTPEQPIRFMGELKQNASGEFVFVPVKGYKWFNRVPQYYTIEEFGREINQSWQKANYAPDDPAEIELNKRIVGIAPPTDLGTVVEQPTGETPVEVDPFASDTVLFATDPERMEEDVAKALREELIQTRSEAAELRDVLDQAQRRLDQAKDVGAMTPQEFLESHTQFAAKLMAVARGRTDMLESADDQDDSAGSTIEVGASTPEDDFDIQRIEENLTNDD